MELIKKIKDAEQQAREIVDQARHEASALQDEARVQRAERLQKSQQQRSRAMEAAVAEAEQKGAEQARQLLAQGDSEVEALKAACQARMGACVEKVVSRLQQAP
jgi:V/A-type H+/Na+-transporting ATPase subunit G/H